MKAKHYIALGIVGFIFGVIGRVTDSSPWLIVPFAIGGGLIAGIWHVIRQLIPNEE